ncbi:MAG: tetratricopeptide repeat protein, partial [Boseongicola sp.]
MRLQFVLTLAVSLVCSTGSGIAEGNAGSYLAARTAIIENNFSEAAKHFTRALVRDPRNVVLLENAMSAYLGLGDIERAVPLARRMKEVGAPSQISSMVMLGDAARRGDWDLVIEDIDAGQTVGPLFDGLARAWAELGSGQMSTATTGFDSVIASNGVEAFGMYHKALALASVGDYESAAKIFSGEAGATIRLTRRGVIAYAQVLSQLEKNEVALELLESTFGANLDPALAAMRTGLLDDETLAFDAVRTPADGMAEIFHSIAGALRDEAQGAYTLLYARMALALRPDHIDALLLAAEILEELERYELATEVYDTVPRSSPAYHSAELGRAEALRRSGREDAAIEVLRQLTESHAEIPLVHVTLGDTLRGLERFTEAIAPYD